MVCERSLSGKYALWCKVVHSGWFHSVGVFGLPTSNPASRQNWISSGRSGVDPYRCPCFAVGGGKVVNQRSDESCSDVGRSGGFRFDHQVFEYPDGPRYPHAFRFLTIQLCGRRVPVRVVVMPARIR